MNRDTHSLVKNFLRRWSTTDITPENGIFFDEHLMGVRAIAEQEELKLLDGVTRATPRAEFAKRYRAATS